MLKPFSQYIDMLNRQLNEIMVKLFLKTYAYTHYRVVGVFV